MQRVRVLCAYVHVPCIKSTFWCVVVESKNENNAGTQSFSRLEPQNTPTYHYRERWWRLSFETYSISFRRLLMSGTWPFAHACGLHTIYDNYDLRLNGTHRYSLSTVSFKCCNLLPVNRACRSNRLQSAFTISCKVYTIFIIESVKFCVTDDTRWLITRSVFYA